MFPIPDSLVKLINKWFNKENSVFVRDEPGDITLTWERTNYLGTPTKRIKTITYSYNTERKKDTYNILYDADGDVQGAELISDVPQKTR